MKTNFSMEGIRGGTVWTVHSSNKCHTTITLTHITTKILIFLSSSRLPQWTTNDTQAGSNFSTRQAIMGTLWLTKFHRHRQPQHRPFRTLRRPLEGGTQQGETTGAEEQLRTEIWVHLLRIRGEAAQEEQEGCRFAAHPGVITTNTSLSIMVKGGKTIFLWIVEGLCGKWGVILYLFNIIF